LGLVWANNLCGFDTFFLSYDNAPPRGNLGYSIINT
jgi:hypothetical protein